MLSELNSKGRVAYAAAKRKPFFDKDLQEIVDRYEVPLPPKHTREEFEKWSLETFEAAVWFLHPSIVSIPKEYKGKGWTADYMRDRISFLEKYGFSIDMHGEAFDDLLLDEAPQNTNVRIIPADWRTVGSQARLGVSILIQEGASRDEVLGFIKKHWRQSIKPNLEGKRKGIRPLKNPELTELILRYSRMSTPDLKKIVDTPYRTTREVCIASILKNKHKLVVEPDNVHQIITRARK